MSGNNERANAAFLDVVNNQIKDNDPPETKKTYKRLLSKGYSDQEARELIATVVSSMVFNMLKQEKEYDEQQYIKDLRRLPKLPWE